MKEAPSVDCLRFDFSVLYHSPLAETDGLDFFAHFRVIAIEPRNTVRVASYVYQSSAERVIPLENADVRNAKSAAYADRSIDFEYLAFLYHGGEHIVDFVGELFERHDLVLVRRGSCDITEVSDGVVTVRHF